MEPTVSPPMRRVRRVEKEQVVRQQFCRRCGQPGDVSAEIRTRKPGRAGRTAIGLTEATLCDYCAAALLGWPTT